MNLLLVEPAELGESGLVRLTDRRADHLRRVLRVAPGARVRAGVVRGPIGEAVVREVSADAVELALSLRDGAPATPPPVELIVAVPRPKVLRRVLQSVAALGVARLELVNAWRVEKSYFDSPALAQAALRAELLLGCEQGATTWLPDVEVHPLLMPFVDQRLGAIDAPTRVLLHPHARAGIETAVPPGAAGRVLAAIGPEGGWIDRELATFEARGFRAVTLGEPVLRVETAIAALLAQLTLLRRL